MSGQELYEYYCRVHGLLPLTMYRDYSELEEAKRAFWEDAAVKHDPPPNN